MRSINLKRSIFFGLIFLFLIIVLIIFVPLDNSFSCITKTRKEKDDLVELILVNDKMAVFDRKKKTLYYSNEYLLKSMVIKIKSKTKTKYKIIKKNNNYQLVVYSKKYYQKIPIIITKLPIINIIYKDNINVDFFLISSYNSVGSPYASNNDYFDVDVEMMGVSSKKWLYRYVGATLNLRGTSSAFFHQKKGYKLEFNKKINMFNIYKDDVFALDGLFTDNSKIRNLLSSDLWNLINDNQDIDNDLVGDYVEVFINGYYKGLYAVKNKVNGKTVDLGNNGLLIKDINENNDKYIQKLINNDFSISDGNYFLNYQVKKYNEDSFNSFIEKLQRFYRNDITYSNINENFEIDNYINYMILTVVINGSDNIVYNKYYSLKNPNSKILLTPWDMDLTWGLKWSFTEELNSLFDMKTSVDKKWLDDYINEYTDKKTYQLLKKRYWELRKNTITLKTINDYIDKYEEELVNSGAPTRDSKEWVDYDIRKEISKIKKWTRLRLAFLDSYFK